MIKSSLRNCIELYGWCSLELGYIWLGRSKHYLCVPFSVVINPLLFGKLFMVLTLMFHCFDFQMICFCAHLWFHVGVLNFFFFITLTEIVLVNLFWFKLVKFQVTHNYSNGFTIKFFTRHFSTKKLCLKWRTKSLNSKMVDFQELPRFLRAQQCL